MASSNIKLFDENKGNMLTDTEFNISTQRLNGLQTGIASSQLQNKAMYQASLIAYAIAQVMMQNGKNANDTDAVSAFVANLSGTMLQKVYDIATTEEAKAGVATGKWMSPALVKAAIDKTLTDKNYLPKSGGTMTGQLNVPAFALTNYNAALEIGKNIDFHAAGSTNDYDARLTYDSGKLLFGMRAGDFKTILHTGNMSDFYIARIATGTYVGTGTCGPDNPNSLTLPFEPKLLMIAPVSSGIDFQDTNTSTYFYESAIWFAGTTKLSYRDSNSSYETAYCTFSASGNTISWYSDTANGLARTQLNTAGTKYAYVAIG